MHLSPRLARLLRRSAIRCPVWLVFGTTLMATLPLGGCAPEQEGCTLIGCESFLVVEVPAVAAEGFSVTLASDETQGSFQCPGADALDETTSYLAPSALSGSLGEDDAPLEVRCTSEGFQLVARGDGPPADNLELEVEGLSSGTVLTATWDDVE